MPERCADLIDKLIACRKERGWSQKELADSCGLAQSAVARFESKKNVPTVSTFCKIAEALGLSVSLS